MMNARTGCLIALLALPGGCARDRPGEPVHSPQAGDPLADVAPAIIAPGEAADPAEPPSYEVAIASAAADRNEALERCARQQRAIQVRCTQEANAAFAELERSLEPLRGNQP